MNDTPDRPIGNVPRPRAARADAESDDSLYLIKMCSQLRVTYQIRLLAFQASQCGKQLVLCVDRDCQLHPSLADFLLQFPKVVRLDRG